MVVGHQFGVPLSEAHKQSIRETLSGTTLTPAHKEKVRLSKLGNTDGFKKGNIPWNKGTRCSEETKQKIRDSIKNRIPWNKGIKTGQITWMKGKHHTLQSKIKLSLVNTGEKVFNGFKGSLNKRARESPEYINWRNKVYKRDNHTCCDCKIRGGYLHAHHVKPFASYKELRFNVKNGITLCKKCHKKIHREEKICQN